MYSRRKDKIVFPLIAVKVKKVYIFLIQKMKFKSDLKKYVFCLEMFVKDYEKTQANCK